MALSGQLSDLSLAELIEFFCNQRKSGRLKVQYPRAPGFFYFQKGMLVDAKIGALTGVEAVYYALTLENASFKFSTSFEPTRRSIHQPWAQVALEGLRRMDEGIKPPEAFPGNDLESYQDDPDGSTEIGPHSDDNSDSGLEVTGSTRPHSSFLNWGRKREIKDVPLSLTVETAAGGSKRMIVYGAIAVAILVSVAAVGVPSGWYRKAKSPEASTATTATPQTEVPAAAPATDVPGALSSDPAAPADLNGTATVTDPNSEAAQAAKREREARERARLADERARAAANPGTLPGAVNTPVDPKKPDAAKPAQKTMTVQVTYDESGRVTQASGGDANAVRIARQKRFPSGKAGTATVTIPVN